MKKYKEPSEKQNLKKDITFCMQTLYLDALLRKGILKHLTRKVQKNTFICTSISFCMQLYNSMLLCYEKA